MKNSSPSRRNRIDSNATTTSQILMGFAHLIASLWDYELEK